MLVSPDFTVTALEELVSVKVAAEMINAVPLDCDAA